MWSLLTTCEVVLNRRKHKRKFPLREKPKLKTVYEHVVPAAEILYLCLLDSYPCFHLWNEQLSAKFMSVPTWFFLCSRPNHHPKPYHLTIFLLFLAADGKSSPRKSHEYSETKNYDEDSEDGEYTACACQRWLFVTICMPLFFVISTLGFILVVFTYAL